jgi:outer membrane protein TolC
MTARSLRLAGATALAIAALATPSPARAQAATPEITLRGVPSAQRSDTPIALTLAEAIRRGLEQNLGTILQEQRVRGAESARLRALSDLVPHVSAAARDSAQVVNLAAYGFTAFEGIPSLIGPFTVFDARLYATAPILDLSAVNHLHANTARLTASQADARQMRETVILAVGNVYLEVGADAARVASARSQVATAETLVRLADDQRAAGLVAGIDVVRQQVELQGARARLIAAQNALDKRKLSLARAIGLAPGQAFEVVESPAFSAAPPVSMDAALADATAHRDDLAAARARVEAARNDAKAAHAEHLPSIHLDADYGALGTRPSDAEKTYAVAASVRIPIFEGGATKARALDADAELRAREAELADLAAGVRYEIEAAMLDVAAAAGQVEVTRSARDLATSQLDQAQDRFRAGVASTLELAQAQDALARASESYITSVYLHAIAKATLARAMGVVEERFVELIGGSKS